MKRPTLALSLLLSALAACGGAPRSPPAPRPASLVAAARGWNLLLLSVDTLRADRLGAYGYSRRTTSPQIDRLLAAGVTFDRAMAQRALTWPSLASVLTGLYPRGHGVVGNGYELPDGLPTLPLLLRAAGYTTGAFLSNMCHANHQGWDAFACAGGQDGKALDGALAWAGGLDGKEPFLLWVHLFGAHPPYYNGGSLAADRLDPGYDGPLAPSKRILDQAQLSGRPLPPRDREHLDAIYDAAVMGSDGLVGRLLDGLEREGRLERTLIVFLADHGEELDQHNGYFYHACSVYQTTLHVPLGMVAPGLLPAGARVPQTVELIDVLPTLLALLAVPPPGELHGSSLTRYLADPGGTAPAKPAFSEYEGTGIQTVLEGDWKLVNNPLAQTPVCLPGAPADFYRIGKTELYDLARDPGETADLAARRPDEVAHLQELLRRRFARLPDRSRPQEVPPELRKKLEALGYVAN